ncbi:restriction endonuclease subunit S [Ferroacidibacillus organovorans]|uniref:Type I restriction modification DNA specificity domain-containing protein n=1 Tax=Ferroacidibacillus organovorans TaxID=1765683 RepID=A0A1V4EQK9_9BACL|nr:restriction endonuclease subunit S [Ferroacidibacillus organovorans]OPG15219.1 hypothetical protein B2M26_12975 [Ferroacidibacillus organovorans]
MMSQIYANKTRVPLKRIARMVYGNSLETEKRNHDGSIPVYGSNGTVGYHDTAITVGPTIVIGRKGSFGKISFSDSPCFPIDTTYFVDERHTPHNLRWLYYLLQTLGLDEFSQDTGVPGLSREYAHERLCYLVSIEEQSLIASFLDRETSKLDQLVEKKQRLIELLQEKRQALITQAVTKGLDPNVPMKDSGIPWLGDVPAHWSIRSLRRVVKTFVDYRGKTPEKTDSGVPLITARNIKNGSIDHDLAPEFIRDEEYFDWMVRGFPKKGDVVMTTEAPLGEVAQIIDESIALAQRLILFKVDQATMYNEFLKYQLLSRFGQSELWSNATGSTALGIKADRLKGVRILVPPLEEQKIVIAFIESSLSAGNELLNKLKYQIEKIQEYRQALISAAVTGQIDVRQYSANEAEAITS